MTTQSEIDPPLAQALAEAQPAPETAGLARLWLALFARGGRAAPPPDVPAEQPRRPITVRWHHTGFEVTMVALQAIIASITMVVALIGAVYIHDEHEDRRQARITRAWTLLHATQETGFYNIGQIEALQSLFRAGAHLRRINLSSRYLQGVVLPGVDLYGAEMSAANLEAADLKGANLSQVRMPRATLADARLAGADLSGAILSQVDLSGADLGGANLEGATMWQADLSGANFAGAAGLSAEQLADACAEPALPPTLPPGLAPPPACG